MVEKPLRNPTFMTWGGALAHLGAASCNSTMDVSSRAVPVEESGAIDSSLRHTKVSRPKTVQTRALERKSEVVYDYAVSRHTLNEHSHKHPPWPG